MTLVLPWLILLEACITFKCNKIEGFHWVLLANTLEPSEHSECVNNRNKYLMTFNVFHFVEGHLCLWNYDNRRHLVYESFALKCKTHNA